MKCLKKKDGCIGERTRVLVSAFMCTVIQNAQTKKHMGTNL